MLHSCVKILVLEITHQLFIIEKKNTLLVPRGFAHGFSVLEESTIFSYKVINYYHSSSESGIIYNDIDLNINWGIKDGIVSEKDKVLPSYKDYCLSL